PYVFEGSKLDFRNYYYYYGFSDLSKSIAEKLHAELSTELLAEHSINHKPDYDSITNTQDSLSDIGSRDETMAVSSEEQANMPDEPRFEKFINSLMVSGVKFNNSAYFHPEYLKFRIEFLRISRLIESSELKKRADLQNQLWELSKKMESLVKVNKEEFSISKFLETKPLLMNILREEIINTQYRDLKIEKYYSETDIEKINQESLSNLQQSIKIEELEAIKKELLKFQKEYGIRLNIVEIAKDEKYSLISFRTILHHLRSNQLFYGTMKKGDVINLHLNILNGNNQSYRIERDGQRTIGIGVSNSVYKTYNYLLNNEIKPDIVKNQAIDNRTLKFIKNYSNSKPINEQIESAEKNEIGILGPLRKTLKDNFDQLDKSYDKNKPEEQLFAALILAASARNENFFDPEYIKLRAEYRSLIETLGDFYNKRTDEENQVMLKTAENKLKEIQKWHQKPAKEYTLNTISKFFEINLEVLQNEQKNRKYIEDYLREGR
ncbi:MAG: hypothetical protein ACRCXZ_00610, partial [Patescibacteria group bacterium]